MTSYIDNENIYYSELIEDSMRIAVKSLLSEVAEKGLPGDHHFYLTFVTTDDAVQMPAHLKVAYPDFMTIVLQNKFWNLKVSDEGVSVDLSFNQVQSTLYIPFRALVAFSDPSVNFSLRFLSVEDGSRFSVSPYDSKKEAPVGDKDNVVSLDSFRKKDE